MATTKKTKVFHRQPTIAELELAQTQGFTHLRTPWLHNCDLAEVLSDLKGNR